VCKIWWTHRRRSYLQDLTVRYTKRDPEVCKIHLALNRGCFEAVLMKNTPRTLGVNP
jgi:hypothetical protein